MKPLDITEAALFYSHCRRIVANSDAVAARPDSSMIPSVVATWGDARLLFPVLLTLLGNTYPELRDPTRLSQVLGEFLNGSAVTGAPRPQ